VCCSVLQCVAVCCSVLQCVAVCCSVLQCVEEPARHVAAKGHDLYTCVLICFCIQYMCMYVRISTCMYVCIQIRRYM